MPATPLPSYTRYFPPGTRQYYWVTSIANPAAPTRAELNAGTDLTGQIAAVNGFTPLANLVDVTPIGSQFINWLTTTVDPGSGGNEIILFAAANGNDARLVMPPGTTGFLVILPEGDVTGQYCEVWPAKVNVMYIDPAMETPGQIHFEYTITSGPSQNVTIP